MPRHASVSEVAIEDVPPKNVWNASTTRTGGVGPRHRPEDGSVTGLNPEPFVMPTEVSRQPSRVTMSAVR